jgi:ATP-dependent RNA helicase DDX27
MKHAPPESIKQRVIPPDVIAEVTKELEDLEGEVKAVQREEKEEKEVKSYYYFLAPEVSLNRLTDFE